MTGELAQVEERPLSTREVFNFVSCLYYILTLKPLMVSQMCLELDVIPRVRLSKADWPLIKGQKNEVHILHQNFIILLIAFCLLGRDINSSRSRYHFLYQLKVYWASGKKIIHLPIHPLTHSLTYFLTYLYLILWNAVYRCSWPVSSVGRAWC